LRLEALGDLVTVQPRSTPGIVDALPDVLAQIPRRDASLFKHPRPDREIADQLDVDVPTAPHAPDQPLRHVPADREMDVQAMPARVPFWDPHVRQRLTVESWPEPLEERGDIGAQPLRIMAPSARVGESSQPIQPIDDRVAPNLRASAAHRLRRRRSGSAPLPAPLGASVRRQPPASPASG